MLVHGEDDPRAPFKQARVMKRALDEAGADVEGLVFPKERLGIYGAEHRAMVYQRIADLLAENRGALTEPVED
jgi:dipeptidyl aminopeptidase/acylaminoacyl peptidase